MSALAAATRAEPGPPPRGNMMLINSNIMNATRITRIKFLMSLRMAWTLIKGRQGESMGIQRANRAKVRIAGTTPCCLPKAFPRKRKRCAKLRKHCAPLPANLLSKCLPAGKAGRAGSPLPAAARTECAPCLQRPCHTKKIPSFSVDTIELNHYNAFDDKGETGMGQEGRDSAGTMRHPATPRCLGGTGDPPVMVGDSPAGPGSDGLCS